MKSTHPTGQTARRDKSIASSRFLRLLFICAGVYLLVCTGCATFQRSMIYFPQKFTPQQVDKMAQAANLERWTNSAGRFIGLKRGSPRRPADGQVLITYGNGSDAAGCAHYADAIQSVAAFDVFILEYPGYADRPGSPGQRSLFLAANEAFLLLDTNKPIYLLGESLGTGVAAYLAGTHPDKVAGAILISPYNQLTSVAQHHLPILPIGLLLVDRFPSEDYLRQYHGPIGMVVGGHDTVVPEKFGLRLYDGYSGPKRLWEFPQAGHIEIPDPAVKFWGEVLEFWRASTRTGNASILPAR